MDGHKLGVVALSGDHYDVVVVEVEGHFEIVKDLSPKNDRT